MSKNKSVLAAGILALASACIFAPNVRVAAQYLVYDLGSFGGQNSPASAINDAWQVTGQSVLTGNFTSHAFLYSNGSMQDIGTLGCVERGLRAA